MGYKHSIHIHNDGSPSAPRCFSHSENLVFCFRIVSIAYRANYMKVSHPFCMCYAFLTYILYSSIISTYISTDIQTAAFHTPLNKYCKCRRNSVLFHLFAVFLCVCFHSLSLSHALCLSYWFILVNAATRLSRRMSFNFTIDGNSASTVRFDSHAICV